jgi:hypothetical protein
MCIVRMRVISCAIVGLASMSSLASAVERKLQERGVLPTTPASQTAPTTPTTTATTTATASNKRQIDDASKQTTSATVAASPDHDSNAKRLKVDDSDRMQHDAPVTTAATASAPTPAPTATAETSTAMTAFDPVALEARYVSALKVRASCARVSCARV